MPSSRHRSHSSRRSATWRSEEHTSELQSRSDLVCRLLLEKKKPRSESQQARSPQLPAAGANPRRISAEHTSKHQLQSNVVCCRLLQKHTIVCQRQSVQVE